VTAVLFSLIVLGVNWAIAGETRKRGVYNFVLGVSMAMTLVVNAIAILAIYTEEDTRSKLLAGLLTISMMPSGLLNMQEPALESVSPIIPIPAQLENTKILPDSSRYDRIRLLGHYLQATEEVIDDAQSCFARSSMSDVSLCVRRECCRQ
jgi:hypothetical protein